jgi:hypothetical protein
VAVNVDRSAVLAGAGLGVAVGAGAIAVSQAIASLTDSDSGILLFLLFVVLLGGLAAGGRRAALRQPSSPLTHGSLAALAAYAALLIAITAIRLALGKEVADPVYVVSNALWAASAGMVGGYLALRQLGNSST